VCNFGPPSILRTWIHGQVLTRFAGRILVVDTAVALRALTFSLESNG
jgi:hypothetical protein